MQFDNDGVTPGATLYVGDTTCDVTAACAFGMDVALLGRSAPPTAC
ncbi:hypothetical protein [Halomarina ordinaria]|uniref:Phosphoglycolate phosphatase n=1 Tax=Halomarina ordinaria TaxID=3033939 RepID=A0ABD5U4R2_9EURY|nr:hypothetical protein [Halomarina sp. PSRA2]